MTPAGATPVNPAAGAAPLGPSASTLQEFNTGEAHPAVTPARGPAADIPPTELLLAVLEAFGLPNAQGPPPLLTGQLAGMLQRIKTGLCDESALTAHAQGVAAALDPAGTGTPLLRTACYECEDYARLADIAQVTAPVEKHLVLTVAATAARLAASAFAVAAHPDPADPEITPDLEDVTRELQTLGVLCLLWTGQHAQV